MSSWMVVSFRQESHPTFSLFLYSVFKAISAENLISHRRVVAKGIKNTTVFNLCIQGKHASRNVSGTSVWRSVSQQYHRITPQGCPAPWNSDLQWHPHYGGQMGFGSSCVAVLRKWSQSSLNKVCRCSLMALATEAMIWFSSVTQILSCSSPLFCPTARTFLLWLWFYSGLETWSLLFPGETNWD